MFHFQNYKAQSFKERYNNPFRRKERLRVIHPVRHIYLRTWISKTSCFSDWFC
jgi:hypothetical protein